METDRNRYIQEVQRFQKNAGVEVSSSEELGNYWDNMKKDRRRRALSNIITHRIIQDLASEAGRNRLN